jgi:hypothetical protein
MKKVLILVAVCTLFATFSCKKSSSSADAAIADVFVRSLKYNGQNAYSTVFSVSSYTPMTEVTVDTPDGVSFRLNEHASGMGTAFLKDTSFYGAGYSHNPPATGVYTFHVKYSGGDQRVFTNTLSNDFLLPPVIDSLYKKPDGVYLRMKWEPVAGADAYEMRITSGDSEIMPWLEYGTVNSLSYERLIAIFGSYLPGTIKFELRALKYESNKNYVQAMSYTTASIDL